MTFEASPREQSQPESGKKIVDNVFATHVLVDRLIMGGEFTDEEIDEAVNASNSYEEIHERLKAILERKQNGH